MRRRPGISTLTDSRDDEFRLTDQLGLILVPPLNEDAVSRCCCRIPRFPLAGGRPPLSRGRGHDTLVRGALKTVSRD